jgi:hypothetical protein
VEFFLFGISGITDVSGLDGYVRHVRLTSTEATSPFPRDRLEVVEIFKFELENKKARSFDRARFVCGFGSVPSSEQHPTDEPFQLYEANHPEGTEDAE